MYWDGFGMLDIATPWDELEHPADVLDLSDPVTFDVLDLDDTVSIETLTDEDEILGLL